MNMNKILAWRRTLRRSVKVAQHDRLAHVLVALALHRAEARLRLDELRRHRAIALAQQLALRGDAELLALGGDAAASLLVHVGLVNGARAVIGASALPVCSTKRSAAQCSASLQSRRAQSICGRPAEDLLEPVLLFAPHCVYAIGEIQVLGFDPRAAAIHSSGACALV